MSHPALDLADANQAAGLQGRDLVISASAGSGKTFTLVTLVVGFLGREGGRPHEVLATTFSRESAADLRARLLQPLDGLAALPASAWADLLEALARGWEAWDAAAARHGLRGEARLAARQWPREDGWPAWTRGPETARAHWVRARREAEHLRATTVHGLALDLLQARSRGAEEATRALLDPSDPRLVALLRRAGRAALALPPDHPDHLPARRLLDWLEGREGRDACWERVAAAHDAHTDALGAWREEDGLAEIREAFWEQARLGLEAHRPFAADPDRAAARTKAGAPHKSFEKHGRGKFGPVPPPDAGEAQVFRFWEDWFEAFPGSEAGARLPTYFADAYTAAMDEALQALPELLEAWLTRLLEPVLKAFEARKRARGWRTYGDLVRDALGLLQARPLDPAPALLLVDEFQDISRVQEAFLRALGARAAVRVGDRKQAIYGFRGGVADLLDEALASAGVRGDAYRLPDNHRSAAPVVATSNAYVAEVVPRLDPGAADPDGLQRDGGRGLGEPRVVVARVASEKARGADLPAAAPWIVALASGAGWPSQGGEAPRSRALLLPRRTGLPALRRRLQARGVDPLVVSQDGFWESPGVRAVLNLLASLARPRDPRPLLAVLRGPWVGMTDPELLEVAGPLARGWADVDPEALPDAAADALAWLRGLATLGTPEVLAGALARPGLLESLEALQAHGALEPERARRNLDRFVDLALSLPVHLGTAWTELARRRLRPEGDAPPAGGTGGALLIQTVHASKGLEYDEVLLPMLAHGAQGIRRGHLGRVAGGPHLLFGWKLGKAAGPYYRDLQAAEAARTRREDLNLLYVGLTRAKERLALLQQWGAKDGAPEAPTPATARRAEDKAFQWTHVAEDLARLLDLPRLDVPPDVAAESAEAEAELPPPPESRAIAPPISRAPEPPERAARRREGIVLHALLRECLVRAAQDPAAVDAHLARSPLAAQTPGARAKVEAFLAALEAKGWARLPRRTELPLPGAGAGGGMGYADLVVWEPDRAAPALIHLVDFKLASALDEARLEAYAAQLRGYAAALKARHPQAGLQAHLWDLEAGRWVELAV
ncbi:MAG: UvrD-helicase domain-containing protein [Holophagaceae bacterium]